MSSSQTQPSRPPRPAMTRWSAGWPNPNPGPLINPSVKRPSAKASSTAPRTSGTRRRPAARFSTSARRAASTANTPSGRFTRNTHRQPSASMRAPPIGGPRPAAMAPAAPHRLTPCARRSAGKASTTSPSEAGTRTAAPMPCSTRNATSSPTLSAIAHSPDATVNNATPKMNTRLRPIRSASLPAATRNAAKTML